MFLCLHVSTVLDIPLISRVLPWLFYCLCLLIRTAIAAPFHTSVMGKNTNLTLIAFTGQQEPDQTTFPSLCSLSCLFATICSRLPYTRPVFAPSSGNRPLPRVCAAPSTPQGHRLHRFPQANTLPSFTCMNCVQASTELVFIIDFLVKVQL